MRVRALAAGEHPLGTWRKPGDEFDFTGETPGTWMDPIKKRGRPPKPKPEPTPAQAPAEDESDDRDTSDTEGA